MLRLLMKITFNGEERNGDGSAEPAGLAKVERFLRLLARNRKWCRATITFQDGVPVLIEELNTYKVPDLK